MFRLRGPGVFLHLWLRWRVWFPWATSLALMRLWFHALMIASALASWVYAEEDLQNDG